MTPMPEVPTWRRWVLRHVPRPLLQEPALLWLAAVCVLSGTSQLLGLATPSLAAQLMPRPALLVWYGELVIGGGLTIVGIATRRVRVLVLGLQPLGLAAVAYAVGLFAVAGSRAILSAGLTLAFAAVCFIKAFNYSTAALGVTVRRPPEGSSP